MGPGCCAGSDREMRPDGLSRGITLSRSRIVVVPSIRLLVPERDGAALFQRMLTDGSSAVVPESSMRVVFACAADAQIMVSARAKKKVGRGLAQWARSMAHSACRGLCR